MKMAKELGTLIEKARKELSKLTGLATSSTVGVSKDERGWNIAIEMMLMFVFLILVINLRLMEKKIYVPVG